MCGNWPRSLERRRRRTDGRRGRIWPTESDWPTDRQKGATTATADDETSAESVSWSSTEEEEEEEEEGREMATSKEQDVALLRGDWAGEDTHWPLYLTTADRHSNYCPKPNSAKAVDDQQQKQQQQKQQQTTPNSGQRICLTVLTRRTITTTNWLVLPTDWTKKRPKPTLSAAPATATAEQTTKLTTPALPPPLPPRALIICLFAYALTLSLVLPTLPSFVSLHFISFSFSPLPALPTLNFYDRAQ